MIPLLPKSTRNETSFPTLRASERHGHERLIAEFQRRGGDQPDDRCGYSFQEGSDLFVIHQPFKLVVEEQRKAERRQEDAASHDDRPERAAAEVSDEGRENDQRWYRKSVGKGKSV